MMFHPRVAQTTILATGSALALMAAALGDHAHAEGKLDASYTISFARIRVGDISATGVFGESEYTISARGRAGGIMKVLVDGEAFFSTHGTIKDGYPVPTNIDQSRVGHQRRDRQDARTHFAAHAALDRRRADGVKRSQPLGRDVGPQTRLGFSPLQRMQPRRLRRARRRRHSRPHH